MQKYIKVLNLFCAFFLFILINGCASLGVNAGLAAIEMLGNLNGKKVESSDPLINKGQDSMGAVIQKLGRADDIIELNKGQQQVLEYNQNNIITLYGFSYNKDRQEQVLREIKEVNNPETYLRLKKDEKTFKVKLQQVFPSFNKEAVAESPAPTTPEKSSSSSTTVEIPTTSFAPVKR